MRRNGAAGTRTCARSQHVLTRARALNMRQHCVAHTRTRVGNRAEASHAQARSCTGMHGM